MSSQQAKPKSFNVYTWALDCFLRLSLKSYKPILKDDLNLIENWWMFLYRN